MNLCINHTGLSNELLNKAFDNKTSIPYLNQDQEVSNKKFLSRSVFQFTKKRDWSS